ncbi:acyl-CoA carboxylase epsilon subunit [Streptomyces sp. NPDC085540]|uniref:acyl-CoA carboxylase epsilon subunit n=1 Tax=Streptomyces sp. NPDC085540 TaxID=3365730 RepID=UPI0037D88250
MSSDFPVFGGPFGSTLFKVIRGTPSAEELAVLTALLTTLAATARDDDGPPFPQGAAWSRPELFPPASWMAGRRSVRR